MICISHIREIGAVEQSYPEAKADTFNLNPALITVKDAQHGT